MDETRSEQATEQHTMGAVDVEVAREIGRKRDQIIEQVRKVIIGQGSVIEPGQVQRLFGVCHVAGIQRGFLDQVGPHRERPPCQVERLVQGPAHAFSPG